MIKRKGFTLLELLLVIGLGAILMGFALITLFGRKDVNLLNDTARNMATSLREAVSRALSNSESASWGVRFDNMNPTSPQYSLFAVQGTPPYPTYSQQPLPGAVRYDSTSLPGGYGEVTFSQLSGTPSDPNFKITIQLAKDPLGSSSTIAVLETGAVSYDLLQCAAFAGCTKVSVIIGGEEGSEIQSDGNDKNFLKKLWKKLF